MPKLLISLRKRLLLPLKWRSKENKVAKGINYPDPSYFVELRKIATQKKMVYLRKNRNVEAQEVDGALKLIEAIIENKLEEYQDNL